MAQGTIALSGTGSTTVPLGTSLSQFSWNVAGVPGPPTPASQRITESINVALSSTKTRFLLLFTRINWSATFDWDVSIPIILTWSSA